MNAYPSITHLTRNWQNILKMAGGLSSVHFESFLILKHDLAVKYSDSGQLEDILRRRQDYPLLDTATWLLNDWEIPNSPQRESFEASLGSAIFAALAAAEIQSAIVDPESLYDTSQEALKNEMARVSRLGWEQIFEETSPFWVHHRHAMEAAMCVSSIAQTETHAEPGGYQALAGLPETAAALWAGKTSELPRLQEMISHLRAALQTIDSLSTLRRDIKNQRRTYPIRRALAAVQGEVTAPLTLEFILGGLIFTGVLRKICEECRVHVQAAREIGTALSLPSFQAYCREIDTLIEQVRALFTLQAQTAHGQEQLRHFFAPGGDILPNILLKAETYLLSDPTFRESWEMQIHGPFPTPILAGKVFSPMLVIEILGKHGLEVSDLADETLRLYQENGFSYYNIHGSGTPDIDELGLALRILPFASEPRTFGNYLQIPLGWLRNNQMPSGQMPVWLVHNDSSAGNVWESTVLYGNHCATVEANLMLGLVTHNWDAWSDVILSCAHSWCDRWLGMGLGATGHYTPLFSLWTSLELIAALQEQEIPALLREKLANLKPILCDRLALEARQPNPSPQSAAFLLLASQRAKEDASPVDPAWISRLVKTQRYDGSWDDEPLFVSPAARGLSTMWYSSRIVTTAFCYHALKQSQI